MFHSQSDNEFLVSLLLIFIKIVFSVKSFWWQLGQLLYHGTILREKNIGQVMTIEVKMVRMEIVDYLVFLFDYELCCNNLECFRQFNLPYLLPDKMEAFQAIYKVFRKTKKSLRASVTQLNYRQSVLAIKCFVKRLEHYI